MSTRFQVSFNRKFDETFSTSMLMEYSAQRLEFIAETGTVREAAPAARLLQDVALYQQWEVSHRRYLQDVASAEDAQSRKLAMRRAALQTLHRKTPFEYLRDANIRGRDRRELMRAWFGERDYAQCIVKEHTAYVQSACSLICADALCAHVLDDEQFCAALGDYETAYSEYFNTYCDTLLAAARHESPPMKSLLPYLRHQLKVIREHLLDGAPLYSEYRTLQALYDSSGDTVALKTVRPR